MRTFLNNNRPWISSAVPIDVVGADVALNAYVCGTVERRMAYALGRFAHRIRRICVRLSDVRAPRGADKSCQIEIHFSRRAPIRVTAADRRMNGAITKVAHVAARQMDELCKRKRGA